jgi:enediyne polyketide synthase
VSQIRLLLLAGTDEGSFGRHLERLWEAVTRISDLGELELDAPAEQLPLRAAVVAPDPEELLRRLEVLDGWIREGNPGPIRAQRGIAFGSVQERPRIGFLFPGQGAPTPTDGGFLDRWLPEAATVFEQPGLAETDDGVPAQLVQLSVVTASVAGLRALRTLGIEAQFGLGHSVGELTALHWAGALDEDAVLRIARRRGEVMTEHASSGGAMANIEAGEDTFARLVDGADVTLACINSPRHRVVSGTAAAVDEVVARAREQEGTRVVRLRVVGAFHSPLMLDAVPVFERYLTAESFAPLKRQVYSTITGSELQGVSDFAALLERQMTEPVRFLEAAREAIDGTHLLLEVGPGRMLSGLVSEFAEIPTLPLRVGHPSPVAFLTAVGAAWVLGSPIETGRLAGEGELGASA